MQAQAFTLPDIVPPSPLPEVEQKGWDICSLAGRFVEISGGPSTAGLSFCFRLASESQTRGGFPAWVGGTKSCFFPFDLAESGIDLAALLVVRLPDPKQVWRASETLIRSGGFSLVVAHISGEIDLSYAMQSRLVGLIKHHNATLIALTRHGRQDNPRGSLVSLRATTRKHRIGHDCFAGDLHVVRKKGGIPGTKHEELFRGSDGLC